MCLQSVLEPELADVKNFASNGGQNCLASCLGYGKVLALLHRGVSARVRGKGILDAANLQVQY